MAIAALDLTLIGRRIPSIRTLPQGQWADHAAYGLTVGLVLRARRSRRARGPAPRLRARPVRSDDSASLRHGEGARRAEND
jgi:hypothetical protein